ncbi:hypothetical protein HPB50_002995 [Hyalomma asiaticum]|uniref:Uncharacterized protein n=1 Tax=Hyalomma asiaticum TaxID=266040 RepID=A0ACB7SK73_HYAAI|nr:hypothetical protein HPB50_002995 [Hyalomma asiaticum]
MLSLASWVVLLVLLALTSATVAPPAQRYRPKWESLDTRPVPAWFDEAKVGILLHWGRYSVPSFGSEWFWHKWRQDKEPPYVEFMKRNYRPCFTYQDFGSQFTAELFDPEKALGRHLRTVVKGLIAFTFLLLWAGVGWGHHSYETAVRRVAVARLDVALLDLATGGAGVVVLRAGKARHLGIQYRSGARYVVLTSKHHEGFALWPSNMSTNWNSQDVGPNRDLLGDLASAVRRKKGMRFGVFHSLSEWFHPLYLADKESNFTRARYPQAKAFAELKELVERLIAKLASLCRYHPDLLRIEGDSEAPASCWNSSSFLAWLYNDSPVRSTVVVNDHWGKDVRCKHGDIFAGCGVQQKRKWEQYVNLDKSSWGYRREARLEEYYKTAELIDLLVSTVSSNGNLLVNVGPTKEGTITPAFHERLRDLGRWLSVNGEAVYGSKTWKHQKDAASNVYYTSKGNNVYAFVLRWPTGEKLHLQSLELSSAGRVTLIGTSDELKWIAENGNGTEVMFPKLTPDKLPTPWALVLKVEGAL